MLELLELLPVVQKCERIVARSARDSILRAALSLALTTAEQPRQAASAPLMAQYLQQRKAR